MAASPALSSVLLLLLSGIAFFSASSRAYEYPPIVSGLSFDFYKSACPNVEPLVRNFLSQLFKKDIGLAAALLRVHFHDCFVQGCDGSILLDGSAGGPSEKNAPPNLTLRPAAFKAINDLQKLVTKACGQVVSCADISALAARDSVLLSGGPDYRVPLGRRDGLTFATRDAVLSFLPSPASDVTTLINALAKLNLDTTDLVTLSGGHTIGIGHCASFKQGLFTSDQGLYGDSRTKPIVTNFAVNQPLFFGKFVYSMTKMGQLSVLTGKQGEIRKNCSALNSGKKVLWSVVDGEGDGSEVF
ncbi:hypothetical protein GW17_00021242 [Ensete ventricosum]|nr:hypothetical protein GW17_00021242 [Ensete ventricosum]